MNYKRGRQIIIHDLRLKAPPSGIVGPPIPGEHWWSYAKVMPPEAWSVFIANREDDLVATIFGLIASACDTAGLPAGTRFDALHVMAHGLEGYVELGKDNLRKQNLHVMAKIANRFRFVVFHCCLVGRMSTVAAAGASFNTFTGSQFARKVAEHTRSELILARQEQIYTVRPDGKDTSTAILDFGAWDGPVDLYEQNLPVRTFNGLNDPPFDLEAQIFGPKQA